MAHGDYLCCAVCDRKLEYVGDAYSKTRICETCLVGLREVGLNILTVQELIDWIKKTSVSIVRKKLRKCLFRVCFYGNDVDIAMKEKGIIFDENHYIK